MHENDIKRLRESFGIEEPKFEAKDFFANGSFFTPERLREIQEEKEKKSAD